MALTSNGVGTCGADDNQAQAGHLVVQAVHENQRGEITTPDVMAPLSGGGGKPGRGDPAICVTGERTHTLTSEGADASEDGTGRGTPIVVALALRGRDGGAQLEIGPDGGPYNAPRAGDGGSSRQSLIAITEPSPDSETIVRRLTELECERLQGYPDDWTADQKGSPRYRQLGNSVAVPVVEWVARRTVAVDQEVRDD